MPIFEMRRLLLLHALADHGTIAAAARSLRLTGPLDLFTTTYGWLITIKAVILVLLGLAGVAQRRKLVPGLLRAPLDRRAFTRFALAEIVFMAIAMLVARTLGLAARAARLAPAEA